MDLKNFKASSEPGVYTLYINDAIGREIQGSVIASEIIYLNRINAERIDIEINSEGGSIIDGVKIASEMLSSKVPIRTINKGYACSMAAILLILGNDRRMVDFGLVMLHNPQIRGFDLEEIKDPKEKEVLLRMKNQLLDLIVDRCKPSRDELSELMGKETWMSFDEAKEYGFVDGEPIVYENSPKIQTEIPLMECINKIDKYYNSIDNNNFKLEQMEDLKKQYEARLEEKESKLKELNNIIAKNKDEFVALKKDYDNLVEQGDKLSEIGSQLQGKIDAQNVKIKEYEDATAISMANEAIEKGLFDPEKREALIEKAKSDPEGFKEFTEMIAPQKIEAKKKPKITEVVEMAEAVKELGVADNLNGMTEFEYLQKNDPKKLDEIKSKNKALYNAMADKYIEANKKEE